MAKPWNLTHNPSARPLGCNGLYGASGYMGHRRRNEPICEPCADTRNHYMRERRRGGIKPRKLKPCGTSTAANRHRLNNEPVCFRCRVAESQRFQTARDRKANEQHNAV